MEMRLLLRDPGRADPCPFFFAVMGACAALEQTEVPSQRGTGL